ncbi:MAG: glycoside hydrolase family 3 C-terminal domain-containing protein, partial [Bacteroidota bacterium]
DRLGIEELVMSDGPHGVRREHGRDWIIDTDVDDKSTYLPVGTSLAATWNPALGYKFGQVLGREARFREKDIILGPGLNIIRSPLAGRNFEYLTEDPYLNSQFVVGYIKGVQENGVAACAKHYIANTFEFEREYVDVQMSDRTLREIYLPGFKAAVQEGGVWTIMSAYNKFRGTYCSHSQYLLDELLKDELGFDGAVISDWNAVKETMEAVNAGVDIEMGSDLGMMGRGDSLDYSKFFMGDTVVSLVNNEQVRISVVDKKVRRILRLHHRLDKFSGDRPGGAYNTPEHQQVAREIADEAIVLLKNEGALPLQKSNIKTLAVIGANADHKHANAGGSSQVKAFYEVTPLAGLQNLLVDDVTINYLQGYEIDQAQGVNPRMVHAAVEAAQQADAVIFVGGWIKGYTDEWNDNAFDAEAVDKTTLELPFGQNALIENVLAANANTIIVMMGGAPMDMQSWGETAPAIVQMGYPGMEGGNALADMLFGKVNPSGKLPMTFPVRLSDSPDMALSVLPTKDNMVIDHKEGVFVGYRYYDSYDVEPAYAFGHGLSYTTFTYENLELSQDSDRVTVKVEVRNTGEIAGKEVVQVYVNDLEASVRRPAKELKGFDKKLIEPGMMEVFEIELDASAFQFYSEAKGAWVLEPGDFEIMVGSSSRDIRLTGTVSM